MKLVLNEEELTKLSKHKLLDHIMRQIEFIDNKRGYDSGVSKYNLINYSIDVLIKISLTNNSYINEPC